MTAPASPLISPALLHRCGGVLSVYVQAPTVHAWIRLDGEGPTAVDIPYPPMPEGRGDARALACQEIRRIGAEVGLRARHGHEALSIDCVMLSGINS